MQNKKVKPESLESFLSTLSPEQAKRPEFGLDKIFEIGRPCQLVLGTNRGVVTLDYDGKDENKVAKVTDSEDDLLPRSTIMVIDGAPAGQTSPDGSIVPGLPVEFRVQVREGDDYYFNPRADFTGELDTARLITFSADGPTTKTLF